MEQQRQLMIKERQQKKAAAGAAAAALAQLPDSTPRAQPGGSLGGPSQGSAPQQTAGTVAGASAAGPSSSEPISNTAQMLQNKRQLTLSVNTSNVASLQPFKHTHPQIVINF